MNRPVRILFVENGIGYGGAVICLRHLVRNLDRDEFYPAVLTGRGGPLYQDIRRDSEWTCISDRIIDIPYWRNLILDSRLARSFPLLGAVLNQALARIDDLVNFFPSFIRTLLFMRRWKPDVVHVNNEPLCNRAALIAACLMHVPVVCHVRGEQRGSFLMRRLFRLPRLFIPVSDWIAAEVEKVGVPRQRIRRIYDGIELDKLDPAADASGLRAAWGVPEGGFAVGLVGLLIPWKGQRLFLEAGRHLLRVNPDMYLIIVGGTPDECRPYEDELRALASSPEFAGRVVFAGHIGNMSEAYNALDIVLSASISPEPLGTVVIESMTLGRPLIAPAHGGALEMVQHRSTGLLFSPGNAESLAETIQELYDSPELRKELGAAARSKAYETFAISTHVEAVQETYRELLKAGSVQGVAQRDS